MLHVCSVLQWPADLLASLAPPATPEQQSELATALLVGGNAIGQRWSTAPWPAGFCSHMVRRVAPRLIGLTPNQWSTLLAHLRIDDLFLAWRAGLGDATWIANFENAFAADTKRLCSRIRGFEHADLQQHLRMHLFVSRPGGAPRVHEYDGVGFLQNWYRVTAARCLIDVTRSRVPAYPETFALAELNLPPLVDPTLAPLQRELAVSVKQAFHVAIAGLEPRARTYLRHAHVDGLTLDQIAALYAVHRATVARVLQQARSELAAQTRAEVVAQLKLSAQSAANLAAYLDSHFELSLSRELCAYAPAADPRGCADEAVVEAASATQAEGTKASAARPASSGAVVGIAGAVSARHQMVGRQRGSHA